MANLLNKSQFVKLADEELEEQIEIRQKLIDQFVGQLYKSILFDEIGVIRDMLSERYRIRNKKMAQLLNEGL